MTERERSFESRFWPQRSLLTLDVLDTFVMVERSEDMQTYSCNSLRKLASSVAAVASRQSCHGTLSSLSKTPVPNQFQVSCEYAVPSVMSLLPNFRGFLFSKSINIRLLCFLCTILQSYIHVRVRVYAHAYIPTHDFEYLHTRMPTKQAWHLHSHDGINNNSTLATDRISPLSLPLHMCEFICI